MTGKEDQHAGEQPPPAAADSGLAALALALAQSARAGPDPKLADFLDKQGALAEAQQALACVQLEHLHEERSLHHRHLALKFFGDRLRIAIELLAVALGLMIVIGLGVMVWQASQDHGLVVESFSAPADLTARGASGQALAEDLTSRVAAIGAAANQVSFSRSEEVRAGQGSELKVEIPQTGISVDELSRFLHRWLGHETVLNGEARDEAGGQVSILLHIAGADPIQVTGPASDLSGLMQKTAERAYATFDPVNNIVYLAASGRGPDALAAAQAFAKRSGFYALLADVDPDRPRALSEALIDTELHAPVVFGWLEAASASQDLGHDQAADDFYRRMIATRASEQPAAASGGYAHAIAEAQYYLDRASGDFTALSDQIGRLRLTSVLNLYADWAAAAAGEHDVASARHLLVRGLAADPVDKPFLEASWLVSAAADDWPSALSDAKALAAREEAAKAAATGPAWATSDELTLATRYRPWLALAEAKTGDVRAAQLLIAASPADCYLCVRMRGQIAEAAGDRPMADHWFAEAVRQAPRLPMAYLDWGQAVLARGDTAGAVAKFTLAHQFGPHFADPLKDWGDALARQGRFREALAKYDEALKDAPNWVELRQARNQTARQAG